MANEPKVMKLNARSASPKDKAIEAVVETVSAMAEQAADSVPAPNSEPAQVLVNTTEESAAQPRTAMEKTMDQATRSTEGFYKVTEEAMEFGRGNMEAFTKATQAYVSGLQDLSKQAFAAMQAINEQALQNAKAVASAKSLKEAAELQTSFAKAQLEKSVAEATRFNEATFKLAEQASAPIAARMTLAMERMTRPATFA
ncbi:phasin [Pseudoroseomonas rhizosphaerae]|uniref:Phasin n=1 Tax=Teichococcus rhizosphaerae TaxID=1335062 RepID=A0A2C7ABX6_9PROT|nr:phasin family protein [Pseudoroseomonas rhizosphaerae]PHK95559.1 phasin [Pseudoroseomonas rhizosphaerae]